MSRDRKVDRIWARKDRSKDPPQRSHARSMRRTPTEAEHKLWWHLRHSVALDDSHFRRQAQVGPYIADFICHQSKLIIELDGGQHASQTRKDNARTSRLESNGYRVLRFWNNDVLSNIEGVLREIQNAISATPTPDPSPQGGGEKKE